VNVCFWPVAAFRKWLHQLKTIAPKTKELASLGYSSGARSYLMITYNP
jgi:hypothetical protein